MSKVSGILIKNGSVVNRRQVVAADVLVEGDKIKAVGKLDTTSADMVFDAAGLLVLPGAIDPHVHFNDEFMNTVSVHDFYSGTLAAAHGGVTSIIDFSNQKPDQSLPQTIRNKEEEADGMALIDWGVHPVLTEPHNCSYEDIVAVVSAGAPTIKCYLTYRQEGLMVETGQLKTILHHLDKAGGMLLVHAEDNDLLEVNIPKMIRKGLTAPIYHARSRPVDVENLAIEKCIDVVREIGGRLFIVHMATADGIDRVKAARQEGLQVFAETCTHYLTFTEEVLKREDGIKWICSPPLRDAAVQEKLWQGLASGVISQVSSDDAAYSWQAKQLGKDRFDRCPNGIPGIEVRLNILYSEGVVKGRITLPRMVELAAEAPARLFGLYPQNGIIKPGSDADLVLFDPEKEWTMNRESLHMAADWSAYEGIAITGKIRKVFSRGDLIVDEGQCLAKRGRGKFLYRQLIPPQNVNGEEP
jgi:dihydropyrimidinase